MLGLPQRTSKSHPSDEAGSGPSSPVEPGQVDTIDYTLEGSNNQALEQPQTDFEDDEELLGSNLSKYE